MIVTVIDAAKSKSTICSFAQAARIIGVTSKTISRWSIIKRQETYNNFTIYFNTVIVKQPIRNKCPHIRTMRGQKAR